MKLLISHALCMKPLIWYEIWMKPLIWHEMCMKLPIWHEICMKLLIWHEICMKLHIWHEICMKLLIWQARDVYQTPHIPRHETATMASTAYMGNIPLWQLRDNTTTLYMCQRERHCIYIFARVSCPVLTGAKLGTMPGTNHIRKHVRH